LVVERGAILVGTPPSTKQRSLLASTRVPLVACRTCTPSEQRLFLYLNIELVEAQVVILVFAGISLIELLMELAL